MGSTQVRGGQIKDADITDADIAAANKDGATGTACMRTLGTGAQQAAAGNHTHAHNALTGLTTGDDHTQYVFGNGRAGGQILYGGTASTDNVAIIPNIADVNSGQSILYGMVIFNSRLDAPQITADQNNYNPTGLLGRSVLRINSNAARSITGLDSNTSSPAWRLLYVENTGSFDITLVHESASSTAANRFSFSGSASRILKPGGALLLYYDGSLTRWRELTELGQKLYPEGIAGGQTIIGGTAASELLVLQSTSNATRGAIQAKDLLIGDTAASGVLTLKGTNNATIGATVLADGICISDAYSPAQITADQTTYFPDSGNTHPVFRINSDAARRINSWRYGSVTANGIVAIIQNVGSFPITFTNESTAEATTSYRFKFPNNQDFILGAGASVILLRDFTTGRWRPIGAATETPLPTLYRQGLYWKRNATDTTNDVDVSTGSCRCSNDTYNIVIGTALTKQLDVAWAVGNNAGGLDTGARANNTWYYIWAIARSDTGVCDILLSASNSAPTMPANYDKKRLIGAIRTGASLLSQVVVRGINGSLYVQYLDPTTNGLDISDTTLTTTKKNYTLNYAPPLGTSGDFVEVLMNFHLTNASSATVWISSPDQTDAAPSQTAAPLGTMQVPAANNPVFLTQVTTNSSAVISARSTVASTTIHGIVIGYYWPGNL